MQEVSVDRDWQEHVTLYSEMESDVLGWEHFYQLAPAEGLPEL